MSYIATESRTDEANSVEVSRGMQGKYSYTIKMYCKEGDLNETLISIDNARKRLEAKLYGEKSPEPADANKEVK